MLFPKLAILFLIIYGSAASYSLFDIANFNSRDAGFSKLRPLSYPGPMCSQVFTHYHPGSRTVQRMTKNDVISWITLTKQVYNEDQGKPLLVACLYKACSDFYTPASCLGIDPSLATVRDRAMNRKSQLRSLFTFSTGR